MSTQALARLALVVGWPSFLVAALLEMVVFAFVDPSSLHSVNGADLKFSANAVYSVAFLVFWVCAAAACLLALALNRSADAINSGAADER